MGEIAEKLGTFAAKAQFSDVPENLVHDTKLAILDSIGCAIIGQAMERGRMASQLAKRLAGPAESTVIGTGNRVSCTNAAYANAEAINVMDFDAMCASHALPAVVGASLAMAESAKASPKDLILAIAVGHEVATRVKSAEPAETRIVADGPGRGKVVYSKTSGHTCSIFGATAGASKILKLDADKMTSAIGTGGYFCTPNTTRKSAETVPLRMTKYSMFGWAAQGGATAALLAQMGFEGDIDVFEGDFSFWRYVGYPEWKSEKVLEDIGAKWKHKITFKQYPVARPIAGVVNQFENIMKENGLQPQDVQKVIATVMPFTLGFRIVRENQLKTHEDYSFNIPYGIACAAYKITPSRWLDEDVRHDPKVLDFMKKVELWNDENAFALGVLEERAKAGSTSGPAGYAQAEVAAKGKTFKSRGTKVKGEPEPGLRFTDEEIIQKFRNNVAKVMTLDKANKVAQTVLELEKVGSVAELMKIIKH